MLELLRRSAGTWVAKLLLLLLVVSFAVWGISGQIATGVSGGVVTAGDTTVSPMEYRLAYDRQMSLLSQRLGRHVTREQAVAFGVDQQVLSQLVAGAVLDEQAREMRLGLSEQRLAELTAEDPAFRGQDGRFDRAMFDYVLRQVGMRPDDYLKSRSQVAIRQQIVDAAADGVTVPETFLQALALYRGEDRTVEYVVVPNDIAGPVADPEDSVLQTWFDTHKDEYRAPEYRNFSYVLLTPEALADPSAISDEEVRRDYERNIALYTTPERRNLRQIVFASREEAEAAFRKLQEGAEFTEIAASEGRTEEDITLGLMAKSDIADGKIAEAAFALEEGAASEVVEGMFGPVLLQVTAIEPEKVQPFEEVEAEIRRELAIGEAVRVLTEAYDQYEDTRAGGATLAEAAGRLDLELRTVEAVDRNGLNPDGEILRDLPESRQLLQEVFASEMGMENPAIQIGSSGYLLYEVNAVTPERERGLDEVRDQVLADWKAAEASRIAAETARRIEESVKAGTAMAEAAGELLPQTRYGIRRDSSDAELGDAGVEAAFSIKIGETALVPGADGNSWLVLRAAERFEPQDKSLPSGLQSTLQDRLTEDLLEQLVVNLQQKYQVTVNQSAIQQALSF